MGLKGIGKFLIGGAIVLLVLGGIFVPKSCVSENPEEASHLLGASSRLFSADCLAGDNHAALVATGFGGRGSTQVAPKKKKKKPDPLSVPLSVDLPAGPALKLFSVKELTELAKVAGAEFRVEKVFDWKYDRYKLGFQTALAWVTAFSVAFITAVLRGGISQPWAIALIALISIGGPLCLSFPCLSRLQLVDREFVSALSILYKSEP